MDRNFSSIVILPYRAVALRKESVDRNLFPIHLLWSGSPSLSARRAWIEIASTIQHPKAPLVALRKESVDRNLLASPFIIIFGGRSPQGERG